MHMACEICGLGAYCNRQIDAKAKPHFAVESSMPSKLDNQACVNALWRTLDPEDAERLELHRLINGLSRYEYVVELLKESLRAQTDFDA
jgi:hypothetical protein